MILTQHQLKILPNLSRATLQRQALLRLVLELACSLGLTYRWCFPLSTTFCKAQQFFTLRTHEGLSTFVETMPIPVPIWLQFLPLHLGRSRGRNPQPLLDHRGTGDALKSLPQRGHASHERNTLSAFTFSPSCFALRCHTCLPTLLYPGD